MTQTPDGTSAPPSANNGRPRVLHVCTDYWPNVGGIERFVADLSARQRERGWSVRILCLNRTAQHRTRLPPCDVHHGVPIRRVAYLDLRYYKPAWLPLRQLGWADVVHVHGLGAHADFVALSRWWHRRPLVLSTHGGIAHTRRFAFLKAVYTRLLQPGILANVDRVVACSAADYELFRSLVKPPRLTRIDNGVELDGLVKAAADASVDRDERRYVFVGRLAPSKRIDLLLEAFAAARRLGLGFQLCVVGPDSGAGEAVVAAVRRLSLEDRIELAGPVSEARVRHELAAAAWFVSASEHEGFGISVVEAMAAGCVPLVQRNAAFAALVEEGVAGHLIDFRRTEDAAQSLQRARQIGSGVYRPAAQTAAARYDWREVTPKWVALYRDVLGGGCGDPPSPEPSAV